MRLFQLIEPKGGSYVRRSRRPAWICIQMTTPPNRGVNVQSTGIRCTCTKSVRIRFTEARRLEARFVMVEVKHHGQGFFVVAGPCVVRSIAFTGALMSALVRKQTLGQGH